MIVCTKCGEEKPLDLFYKNKSKVNDIEKWCKVCCNTNVREWRKLNRERKNELERIRRKNNPDATKNSRFKYLYGISINDYEMLFDKQNGRCAICNEIETSLSNGQIRALAVDHDHITGQVRGLLCDRCNRGIGYLRDDPDILRAAIYYLEHIK